MTNLNQAMAGETDGLISIDHTNVTVLGSKWRASAPWAGLDFKRAELREQSTLGVFLFGKNAPPDHHLRVPWCHPDDQPEGWADDCWYRVRPASKRHRFVKRRGKWWLTPAKMVKSE